MSVLLTNLRTPRITSEQTSTSATMQNSFTILASCITSSTFWLLLPQQNLLHQQKKKMMQWTEKKLSNSTIRTYKALLRWFILNVSYHAAARLEFIIKTIVDKQMSNYVILVPLLLILKLLLSHSVFYYFE